MRFWLRKFTAIILIGTIAVLGMTTPRLAHASHHAVQTFAMVKHDHHAGLINGAGAARLPSDETDPQQQKGKPDHPCCGAACMVFIFLGPTADLLYPRLIIERWMTAKETFPAAPIFSIERPPRTI